MLPSYTVIRVCLATQVTRKNMNKQFLIKVIFGDYYNGLCDVYSVKRALKHRRNVPVR